MGEGHDGAGVVGIGRGQCGFRRVGVGRLFLVGDASVRGGVQPGVGGRQMSEQTQAQNQYAETRGHEGPEQGVELGAGGHELKKERSV